ncbi:MAG: hypothetical protein CBC16_08550, partial [Verrucomicrobia bacterium TMED56]
MKQTSSLLIALLMVAGSVVAQIQGTPQKIPYSNKSIGYNPNIDRSGIALGNHFILNGYANVEFFSKDEDGVASGSWMEPLMNMFNKDTGFNAYADLDSHIKFDPVSLKIHTNVSDAIFVEQLYLDFQVNDVFSLEAGKFVSHRSLIPEELNEKFFRTSTYHLQQGFLGTKFSILVMEELFDLVTDAVTASDQAAIDNLVSIFGIDAVTDLNDPQFDTNTLMASVSKAYVEMFSSLMLLRDDYKTSYNKGIRGNVSLSAVDLSFAITESIWNQMPDMGDGDFALDLNAVIYLNPSFAGKIGYAYESAESVGSLLGLVIPDSSDDIHHLNTGIEFKNAGFTSALEYDYMKLNPLDTNIWDLALLLHYQVNDLFGLGFQYSHEDLETPMGDGDSDKFSLSLNFNVTDNFLI